MGGSENGDGVVKPADAAAAEGEDEDTMVGPGPAPRTRPKRPLQFEHAYLDSLPCAHMYITSLVFSIGDDKCAGLSTKPEM